jgi:hypothetical protein
MCIVDNYLVAATSVLETPQIKVQNCSCRLAEY